jgi:hypothetical protein
MIPEDISHIWDTHDNNKSAEEPKNKLTECQANNSYCDWMNQIYSQTNKKTSRNSQAPQPKQETVEDLVTKCSEQFYKLLSPQSKHERKISSDELRSICKRLFYSFQISFEPQDIISILNGTMMNDKELMKKIKIIMSR